MDLTGSSQHIPENANARISMFEYRDGGGDKRIVAERSLHGLSGNSIEFTLDIERHLIDPSGDYGLRGEILSPDGVVLWASKKATKIRPIENESKIKLELVPSATDSELTFEQYRCDDGFHFAAAIQDDIAVVRLGNRRMAMPATKHEGRYKGEHGNQLSKNPDSIEMDIDDSAHENCTRVASQLPPESEKPVPQADEPQSDASARDDSKDSNTDKEGAERASGD